MRAILAMGLGAVLMAALVLGEAGPAEVGARRGPVSPPFPVSCEWRPHPRSHEKSAPRLALAEVERGLWLIANVPYCGVGPLTRFVNRWGQRLVNGLLGQWGRFDHRRAQPLDTETLLPMRRYALAPLTLGQWA